MDNRTGLAKEVMSHYKSNKGIKVYNKIVGGVEVTDTRVDASQAHRWGLRGGRYISMETAPQTDVLCVLLRHGIEQLIPSEGIVLIAGIGNRDITQDSLGPRVAALLSPTQNERYTTKIVSAAVTAKTGIDTAAMIKAMIGASGADVVIVIDALACEDILRIGKTVQLTDTGIVPGAGASAARGEISEKIFGIPCIAIGVPTVTELASVTGNSQHEGMLVSTADCDDMVSLWAEVIASALQSVFK